jgi:putative MFS transporter
VIAKFEASALAAGKNLPEPVIAAPVVQLTAPGEQTGGWRELFSPLYGPRSLLLWVMWFGTYLINNGLLTWLPTLYKTVFHMPVDGAIRYGFIMSGAALIAAFACALAIDKVGRRRWYVGALFAPLPLVALYFQGASSAMAVLPGHTGLCGHADCNLFALPLFRRTLSHSSALIGCGSGQRMAAARLHGGPLGHWSGVHPWIDRSGISDLCWCIPPHRAGCAALGPGDQRPISRSPLTLSSFGLPARI